MSERDNQLNLLMGALTPALALAAGLPAINSLLNSFVVGHFIGPTALAAIGFAGPLFLIPSSIGVLLSSGAQIESGQQLGRGDRDGLYRIFNTTLATASIIGLLLAALMLVFNGVLPVILGAGADTINMTTAYISAMAPGVLFSVLFTCMMIFAQLERASKVCTAAVLVMLVVNMICNLVNVLFLGWGLLGAGLSTSLANMAAVLTFIPYFIKKSTLFRFEARSVKLIQLPRVLYLGAPSAIAPFCCIFRDRIINSVSFALGGNTAMAAISIGLNLQNAIGATVESGYCGAANMIASVLVGEGDVDSLRTLPRTISLFAFPWMWAAYLLVFVLAKPLALLFGAEPENIIVYVTVIRILNSWYLTNPFKDPPQIIYRALGKVKLVSVFIILNLLVFPVLGVMLGKWTGSLYAACSFAPLPEILMMLTFVTYYRIRRGKFPTSIFKATDIPNKLTAPSARRYSACINTLEDATRVSAEVISFCLERGVKGKTAKMAGLCVEELAVDSLSHANIKKGVSIDLRLICEDGGIRMMLRDNGAKFDPKAYLELASGDDDRSLGLKLAAGCAKKMEYSTALGLNVIRIEIN